MKDLIIIIMAGGLGKRMKSDIPKVLHKVGDESLKNFHDVIEKINEIIESKKVF